MPLAICFLLYLGPVEFHWGGGVGFYGLLDFKGKPIPPKKSRLPLGKATEVTQDPIGFLLDQKGAAHRQGHWPRRLQGSTGFESRFDSGTPLRMIRSSLKGMHL